MTVAVMTAAEIVAEFDDDEIDAQDQIVAMLAVHANHWQVEAYLEGAYWQQVYQGPHRHIAINSVRDHDQTRVLARVEDHVWVPVEPAHV
jgi:hypothetical protein